MQKILIIEDDKDIKDAVQTHLVSKGYNVRTAESSEEGLKLVMETKPDLILLDIMTRSLHGSVFVERLRNLPPGKNDSKVIIFTNLDNDMSKNKFAGSDVAGYLIKAEVSLEQIADKVSEVLGS